MEGPEISMNSIRGVRCFEKKISNPLQMCEIWFCSLSVPFPFL
jgi:hypothetical protein